MAKGARSVRWCRSGGTRHARRRNDSGHHSGPWQSRSSTGRRLPTALQPRSLSGADRLAASLSFSCCFRKLNGGPAPDLNDLATLKILVPLLLAPSHEGLPVTVDL